MSKDIWHKPSETTDIDNNLIIDDWTNGTYELGYFDDNDMIFKNFRNDDIYYEESMMRWCDVDELIDDYNRTKKQLELYKDFADSAKRTLDGSNDMIKSWHKLLQSDYDTETKCHILNSAISAYVQEREKHALKELDNE